MVKQVRVTPEEYASRWGAGLNGSIERIRSGVLAVTVAPGTLAAKKADKWQAAIARVETKTKWAQNVAGVSLEDWQSAMLNKGLNRIPDGVAQAQPKMATYGARLIAHQDRLLAELDGMADITLEDSIRRATFWIRGMAKLTA